MTLSRLSFGISR